MHQWWITKFHNLIQDGPFWGGDKKAPLPEICHTYPTLMKLGTVIPYLKKVRKNINHVTQLRSYADISIFSTEICIFCYIKKYKYRLHFNVYFLILLTFLESLKVVLINLVAILMMSAKLVTLDLLKKQAF